MTWLSDPPRFRKILAPIMVGVWFFLIIFIMFYMLGWSDRRNIEMWIVVAVLYGILCAGLYAIIGVVHEFVVYLLVKMEKNGFVGKHETPRENL